MTTTPPPLPELPDHPCTRLLTGTGHPVGLTLNGDVAAPADGTYPAYRWGWAPAGLATRRQLAAHHLAPVGEPVARLSWRRGRRWADLWPTATARPKHTPTTAQLAALAAAMRTRSTCTQCGHLAPYCLPTRNGRLCVNCDPATHGTDSEAVAA